MQIHATFNRLGITLDRKAVKPYQGVLNPASARLRDGTLQLYPRMVAEGNISRIGSFRASEPPDGKVRLQDCGFALEPEAPYELRGDSMGHGCEDPRVTFIPAIERYVIAYVALGPRGPEVAVAVSSEGLAWQRLGLMCFKKSEVPFADKDAAFFPEPVTSPAGIRSLAFYHRPTLKQSVEGEDPVAVARNLRPEEREGIAIGYVPLDRVLSDVEELCNVEETHRLQRPPSMKWGKVKVGAGTPPVRIREGWMAAMHGVDEARDEKGKTILRYAAGLIVHDSQRLENVVYRSPEPLFFPETPAEVGGAVRNVVFPTAIDRRGDREFDIYYGMGDDEIGRGRLTLD